MPLTAERPNGRLRVSLVSFDFGDFSVPLANALASRCDVLLQTHEDQLAGRAARLGEDVSLNRLEHPRLRQPLGQVRMMRSLRRAEQHFGADLTHVQQGHLWFNLSLVLPTHLPLVVSVHDPTPHLGDAPSRKTPASVMAMGFHRANLLIAHSDAVRDRLVDELGVHPDRIRTVPLLAPDGPPPTTAPGGPPTVLFFGRIWPYKGLDNLIRAERQIAAAVPDVRFVIAGQGEDFAPYRQMMTDPSRYDVHLRHVSEAERDALFASAHIVVLPYVDATQSGVVPIANRLGRAVVASAVGGLTDQIDHGETGLLVRPGDPSALAEAITTLLRDAQLRDRLSETARRRQMATAGPDVVADATLAAYRSVLDGGAVR